MFQIMGTFYQKSTLLFGWGYIYAYMAIILGPNNELMTASLAPTASLAALAFSQTVPSYSGSFGTAGTVAYDTGSFYVCVATNTWRKVTLTTF